MSASLGWVIPPTTPQTCQQTSAPDNLGDIRYTASHPNEGAKLMSVYKMIEIVGTSPESWDKAAAVAVERAGSTLRDLRVAEVTDQDVVIENGKISLYRTKLKISFKFEDG